MKTAISLPDPLFEKADKLAAKLGKTRSELYREAVADYLLRHDEAAITRAINEVVDDVGSSLDPRAEEAARRVLARTEW